MIPKLLKHIVIDIAGVALIIGSILLGWLPGPGGIPLFIAGLSLLAINYAWARRLLKKGRSSGQQILQKLFPDNRRVKAAYDVLAPMLFVLGITLFFRNGYALVKATSIWLCFVAVAVFLFNRRRYQYFANLLKSPKQ